MIGKYNFEIKFYPLSGLCLNYLVGTDLVRSNMRGPVEADVFGVAFVVLLL